MKELLDENLKLCFSKKSQENPGGGSAHVPEFIAQGKNDAQKTSANRQQWPSALRQLKGSFAAATTSIAGSGPRTAAAPAQVPELGPSSNGTPSQRASFEVFRSFGESRVWTQVSSWK